MPANFLHFDEFTYPEVASLPRDIRIALPLGCGFDLTDIAASLGAQADIYLLPGIPFGWPGSRLEVPLAVFSPMVRNLLGNLLEDGFTNAVALVPSDSVLESDIPQIVLPIIDHPVLIPDDADREKVVIIPIGHTEQHGYHAPLSTDTIIIEAIAKGTAEVLLDQATCLPVSPYGVSTHRHSFPGTFNVGGRVFEDFWMAVIDTLAGRGFNRFYLLSGHSGSCSFLVNVVKYAGERHPYIFCATTGLYLNGPKGVEALQTKRQSPISGMGHACELETSLILALRPDLIHLERAVDETDFISTPSYYMDWIEGGTLVANPPWEDDTRTGAYGAGSLGTKEKGDYWLKVAIEEKADHVAEIHEQYFRRRERRPAPKM